MKRVLGPWGCDLCDDWIADPEEGIVRFVIATTRYGPVGVKVQIIHNPEFDGLDCLTLSEEEVEAWEAAPNVEVYDWDVRDMQRPGGFQYLLSLIEEGVFAPATIVEVVRRLYVPGYEQELLFDNATCADTPGANGEATPPVA